MFQRAYHGDPAAKAAIIAQLEAHRAADQLVRGQYWESGKGCAVGCTLHSGNHAEYEPRFGIPVALAHLEDRIFEGLPNARAMLWPVEFMASIPVGADLSRVQWQFLHWLLTEEAAGREPPLWASRQHAEAIRVLRDAQTEIAGPAIAKAAKAA